MINDLNGPPVQPFLPDFLQALDKYKPNKILPRLTGHSGLGRGNAAMETRADAASVRGQSWGMTPRLTCFSGIVWEVPSVFISVLMTSFPSSVHFFFTPGNNPRRCNRHCVQETYTLLSSVRGINRLFILVFRTFRGKEWPQATHFVRNESQKPSPITRSSLPNHFQPLASSRTASGQEGVSGCQQKQNVRSKCARFCVGRRATPPSLAYLVALVAAENAVQEVEAVPEEGGGNDLRR